MKKATLGMLFGLVAMLSFAMAAFGEESEEKRPDKPERPGIQARHHQMGKGVMEKHQDMRRRQTTRRHQAARSRQTMRNRWRAHAVGQLMNTEEGKAERERFKKVMEGLGEDGKALRESVQKDIKGGTEPKESFKKHEAKFKALMKKRILAGIEHREKLLSIARAHVDETIDKMQEKMHERAAEHKERREQMRDRRRDDDTDRPDMRRRHGRGDDMRRRGRGPEHEEEDDEDWSEDEE